MLVRSQLLYGLFAIAMVAGGCGSHLKSAQAPGALHSSKNPFSSGYVVTGVWEWSFQTRDSDGDERTEREEWHLEQDGSHLEGYYDRVVDVRSLDDRLFRCNQRLSFRRYVRVHVVGQVEKNRIYLKETQFESLPGPCEEGGRNLVEYHGMLLEDRLALRWGPEAWQMLSRVVPARGVGLARLAPAASTMNVNNGKALSGVWQWQLRSVDAEGDERSEQEDWHLTENDEGISGYYDRIVKRSRPGGAFGCNGTSQFETMTRYQIVGQRLMDRVVLTEIQYESKPNSCDNGLRRLDTYQGQVSEEENLVLSWGGGNQVLHKKSK